MAQYVPDNTTAYEADLDNLVQALKGNTVESAGAVTAQTVPNMTVQVAAGKFRYGGSPGGIVANASLAISAADPTNARIDLVSVQTNGTVVVTAGTPSATPKPASLPATNLLLALVSVAAAATNIQNSNISDRRIVAGDGIQSAVLASRPPANTVPSGTLYNAFDADTSRSDGITWYDVTSRYPNLIPNSDYARRTVLGLAMPEVFADTNGYIKLDVGAPPTVGSNIVTFAAVGNELAWANGSFVWRDARASATFKAVSTTGNYQLKFRVDANNWISVKQWNAQFRITKSTAAADVDQSVTGQALTLNRWYWIELELQGQTAIAKIYDTGGTVPGVAKSSSTLLASLTVANLAYTIAGATVSITSDQSNAQWGGISATPGGVYVETWLPESWDVVMIGTLGGQALGYDEAANNGPLNKPFSLRGYIPHITRSMRIQSSANHVWSAKPSTSFTASIYGKTSGMGGGSTMLYFEVLTADNNNANAHSTNAVVYGSGDATWNRKAFVGAVNAADSTWFYDIYWNVGLDTTGNGYIQCAQIEEGAHGGSAWRNAPSDDAPIVWNKTLPSSTISTTSATRVEVDSRDGAGNFFLPWDATVRMTFATSHRNSGTNSNAFSFSVDGSNQGLINDYCAAAASDQAVYATFVVPLAAGKHRLAALFHTSGGTASIVASSYVLPQFIIEATRGK